LSCDQNRIYGKNAELGIDRSSNPVLLREEFTEKLRWEWIKVGLPCLVWFLVCRIEMRDGGGFPASGQVLANFGFERASSLEIGATEMERWERTGRFDPTRGGDDSDHVSFLSV
jgi:hypothetical protein